MSGYSVVAASFKSKLRRPLRIFDVCESAILASTVGWRTDPHGRSCPFSTLATSHLRLPFCARETSSPDDNHGPPFLLQDLQGPP
jgi:hypothetical protein